MTDAQFRGLLRQTRRIHGWFSAEAARLFVWIDEIQRQNGVKGGLFEIGVHHGKSAALLGALAARDGERFGACDLFEDQQANTSISGHGDRQIFESNMRRIHADSLDLRVFAKPSAELDPEEIEPIRFFHVDGGHSRDEALGDLRLASRCLVPLGVAVVDDAFRVEWPGVTEALYEFLAENPEYVAVASGFNKAVLCSRDAACMLAQEFDREDARNAKGLGYPIHLKRASFGGWEMRVFHVPAFVSEPGLVPRLRHFYRSHPVLQSVLLRPAVKAAKGVLKRS
jgi:hypothetical protein